MPFIPTVTPQEDARQRPPDTRASPEAFGAGIGAAMQGLGQSIGQFAGSVAGLAEKQSGEGRDLNVATEYANFDYNQEYFNNINNAPADGSGLIETQTGGFDAAIEKATSGYLEKYPGDTKGADALRMKLLGLRPGVAGKAAADAFNMKNTASVNASQTGLATQLNSVRDDPTQYQKALDAGLGLIDAQPGFDAGAKDAGKAMYRSQTAVARFEAMIMAADPEDIPAIQAELGEERWRSQFTAEHYEATVKAVATAERSKNEAARGFLTQRISDVTERTNAYDGTPASLMDEGELLSLRQQAVAAGMSPEQIGNLDKAITFQQTYRTVGPDASPDDIREAQRSVANRTINQTSSTPFLLGKLAKGKPSYYVTNLDPRMQTRLSALMQAGAAAGFGGFSIFSGARTTGDQERIIGGRPRSTVGSKYGSKHVFGEGTGRTAGMAVDLGWNGGSFHSMPKAAQDWIHANAAAYGIAFPIKDSLNEPWHAEIVEARGGAFNGANAGSAPTPMPASVANTFERTSKAYGLPPGLLGAVWMQESGGKVGPNIRNTKSGAEGPFQIMPATKKLLEGHLGRPINADDIGQSAEAAGWLLNYLLKKYNGNTELALMGYNWGEGNVDDYIKGKGGDGPPQETRDYVQKVMGYMGSGEWQSAAGAPGTASAGPMSQQDFWAYSALGNAADKQEAAINKGVANWGTSTYGVMPDGGSMANLDLSNPTPEAFAERGQGVEYLANRYNVAANKPFTDAEENALTQIMAQGDDGQNLAVMAAIGGMSKGMRDAAYKQLGQTDGVWAMAGRMASGGNPQAAVGVLWGRKKLTTYEGGSPAWNASADDAWSAAQGAMAGFNPDDIGPLKGAAKALYAYNTRFKPGDAKDVDPDMWAKTIEQLTGMKYDRVNGLDTFLPPELDGDTVDAAMSYMSLGDYIENSMDKLPPVDSQGRPVEDWALEQATVHLYDDEDKSYQLVLPDGGVVAVNDARGMRPFLLQLEPATIKAIVERGPETAAAAEETAPEAAGASPFGLGGLDPTDPASAVPPAAATVLPGPIEPSGVLSGTDMGGRKADGTYIPPRGETAPAPAAPAAAEPPAPPAPPARVWSQQPGMILGDRAEVYRQSLLDQGMDKDFADRLTKAYVNDMRKQLGVP